MRPNPRSAAILLLALLMILDLSRVLPAETGFVTAAAAQDDDDDDGGDDDDDDRPAPRPKASTRPSTGVTPLAPAAQPATPAAPVTPRRQAAPLPVAAEGEIVVTGLSEADLAALLDQGFAVIEAATLVQNGPVLHRLRVPDGLTLDAARSLVRQRDTGQNADFNHYFRSGQAVIPAAAPGDAAACAHLNCAMLAQIDWPAQRDATCQATVEIGVIDTGVNLDHAGLGAASVDLIRVTDDALPASGETHGTAVVALLVGAEARAPGLLPEGRIVAVDIFSRPGGDERADVVHLIRALDLMSQRGIRVANLSLAGPENTVLSDMLAAVAEQGMLVVAAVGNAGPAAPPAWPAAAETVLAVTAVDKGDRIYRRAQRGDHLDLAAPGVEVWSAAAVKGVKPRTGTSYAAPFATAAAAILMSRDPMMTPASAVDRLMGLTRDIGPEGEDDIYGAGVLSLARLCDLP